MCGITLAVVNPETREICHSGEIGEIWVLSEANVQEYAVVISPLAVEARSDSTSSMIDLQASRFNASIMYRGCSGSNSTITTANETTHDGGDSSSMRGYVRTGEIGFLWNYADKNFNNGQATSLLFVLGSIGETFEVNGLLHFPIDVEATIEKSHPNIASGGR